MVRKIMIVLATTAVLSGGLTANAVARATGHTGWDGLGDGDAHAIATLARKQQPIERRYDPWGHWGGYYGPMIGNP